MPLFWLTFAVGVLYTPGLPSNSTVGRWIAFGLLVSYALRGRPIIVNPGTRMLIGLLVWIGLGFTWAVSFWEHFAGAWKWIVVVLAFSVAASTDDFRPAWRGLALAITCSAIFSIAQWLGYTPVTSLYEQGSVGLFLSKNMAAEIMALALIGAVGLTIRDWREWWTVPGPLVSILLVNSRTAAAMVATAIAVSAYLGCDRQDRAFVAIAGACLTALLTAWLALHPEMLHGGFFRIDDRLAIWSAVLPTINAWGDGLGSFQIAMVALEFPHSEFIQLAFEMGVGSLLVWGVVIYAFGSSRILERVALASFLMPCALWFPLAAPATTLVFALLAGSLCGDRHRARVSQSRGRESCVGSAGQEPQAVGAGSLPPAHPGWVDLPARQEPSVVGRNFRSRV